MSEINLLAALNLWVAITGVEPGERNNPYTLGDLGIKRLHDEIQEALDLDPSELTGNMLFSYIVQAYFEDKSFSVDTLVNEPEKVAIYLEKAHKLSDYLRGEQVAGLAEQFSSQLLIALERYDAVTDNVRQIVTKSGNHGDKGLLAILRRDAMRTMANLQVNQFLDGNPEPSFVAPKYGKFLYRWQNINSMLLAMVNMPSGITINMIQTPDNPYGVYFAFVIRNGGRLFVFTDKEATPHPLAESMWRRPDKVLAERANRNWFPYELAGLKFNDEGKAYIQFDSGTSLVEYQKDIEPIKPLSELTAPQVIWITMMLDLIVDKFWNQGHTEKQLSYTGEMVKVATPLLKAAQKSGLPVTINSQSLLTVEPITLDSIINADFDEAAIGKKFDDRHQWMEDRYKHLVIPESIDLVSDTQDQLLLRYDKEQSSTAIATLKEVKSELRLRNIIFDADRIIHQTTAKISALNPTAFGTKEELENDRLYLARANYASQINKLAEDEFEARKDEVFKWVEKHVIDNIEALKPFIATERLLVKTIYNNNNSDAFWDQAYCSRYLPEKSAREFINRKEVNDKFKDELFHQNYSIVLRQMPYKNGFPSCFFTGAKSSYMAQIVPETVEQLAFLCGVEVSQLPDVLQHWTMIQPPTGNSILRRIDPMIGMVDNPWMDMHFRINIFLSKKAMKDIDTKYANQLPQVEWIIEKS